MRSRAAVLVLLLLLLPALAAALDVPSLEGRVNDRANLIPPDARQRIEQKLAGLEQRTGAQVAVLTIPSLEGDSLEDFSLRVAETWKLGQAGKDNGALLLVAQQDRKMRIEVGYGLEPVLTDLETSLIQRDYIIPKFRSGDYSGGIEAGVDAIVQAVEGEVQPAPEQPQPVGSPGGGGGGNFLFFLFIALFFLGPFSLNAARSGSWLVCLFLLPFYFFLGSMVSFWVGLLAAGAWLIAFPILRMILPRSRGPFGSRRGGGWFIGPGFGGGGGRGGWGGGGGFSGGGGSFGGGGSSSSW
ncbi:MAG TPA: TPM domain-containing protein [Thermoanaerobaculia bacterium]|nr:TPM domain-containing protein [Thermoanaerobaculia bacterium]